MNNSNSQLFVKLQKQIEEAKKTNQPIDIYVKEQIAILEQAHDEFLKSASKEGYDMNSIAVGEIEMKQYSAMKQLALQIGEKVDKYDKSIRELRVRILGEEVVKEYFD